MRTQVHTFKNGKLIRDPTFYYWGETHSVMNIKHVYETGKISEQFIGEIDEKSDEMFFVIPMENYFENSGKYKPDDLPIHAKQLLDYYSSKGQSVTVQVKAKDSEVLWLYGRTEEGAERWTTQGAERSFPSAVEAWNRR